MTNKKKIYLASGWFNPTQAEELTRLEDICDSREWIDLASPRRIFVCPPDAPKETQDATFDGNLHHIKTADFLIVNTRDKDIGTIWEAGFAYANEFSGLRVAQNHYICLCKWDRWSPNHCICLSKCAQFF